MITKLIEATTKPRYEGDNARNWGKFMVARFDAEWRRGSEVSELNAPLLGQIGWTPDHIVVFDLQTGEGAIFRPGGYAVADLDKHMMWVCPLFQPFLEWVYKQDLTDLSKLPNCIELPAEFEFFGYRRGGPTGDGHPEYYDPSFPERTCDREECGKTCRGPAVYCSFTCAVPRSIGGTRKRS